MNIIIVRAEKEYDLDAMQWPVGMETKDKIENCIEAFLDFDIIPTTVERCVTCTTETATAIRHYRNDEIESLIRIWKYCPECGRKL